MICEIRFLGKGTKYDKKLAAYNRECSTVEEALRFAAAVLKASNTEEQAAVTSVRIRVVVAGEVAPVMVVSHA